MTPEEITNAYEVLAQNVQDDAVARAAKIGNSQRSLGLMAERVASPSGQTNGLANYTYNRLMRPTVDTATAGLIAQGKSQALNNYLTEELRKAKNAYEDAKNNYTAASTSPTTSGGNEVTGFNKVTDPESVAAIVNSAKLKDQIVDSKNNGDGTWNISYKDDNGVITTYNVTGKSQQEATENFVRIAENTDEKIQKQEAGRKAEAAINSSGFKPVWMTLYELITNKDIFGNDLTPITK